MPRSHRASKPMPAWVPGPAGRGPQTQPLAVLFSLSSPPHNPRTGFSPDRIKTRSQYLEPRFAAESEILRFPRWCSDKESTCQGRRHKRHGFDPWVGKIPWRRKWQPTPAFLPGEFHGQRSLEGYSPWGCKRVEQDQCVHVCACTHTHTHTGIL